VTVNGRYFLPIKVGDPDPPLGLGANELGDLAAWYASQYVTVAIELSEASRVDSPAKLLELIGVLRGLIKAWDRRATLLRGWDDEDDFASTLRFMDRFLDEWRPTIADPRGVDAGRGRMALWEEACFAHGIGLATIDRLLDEEPRADVRVAIRPSLELEIDIHRALWPTRQS
jgi:hypothetical protein